ncbi:hypothetical protein OFB92_35605, partial [Escherichia coli]|nr:hypothetical protein [Escherichia coli]
QSCEVCGALREAVRATRDDATIKTLRDDLGSRKMVLVNAVQTVGMGAAPRKVVLLGLPVGVAGDIVNLVYQRIEDGINLL